MIVVDTNVISYLLIPGEKTESAKNLLREEPAWIAPRLWRSEFRNVLALHLRKGLIELKTALELMERAEYLLREREFEVESAKVLLLSRDSSCSAYDCEYVTLAKDLGVKLVTADARILRDFPDVAISLGPRVG